jgi:hypothetical protein
MLEGKIDYPFDKASDVRSKQNGDLMASSSSSGRSRRRSQYGMGKRPQTRPQGQRRFPPQSRENRISGQLELSRYAPKWPILNIHLSRFFA